MRAQKFSTTQYRDGDRGLTSLSLRAQNLKIVDAAKHDKSVSNPGPENDPLKNIIPDAFLPPSTDHGNAQTFWNSFSSSNRKMQEGGWSRYVTVDDFPISKDIAGVNMRLTAGGIREFALA